MSKWANYGISAVKFNSQRTLVEKVVAQLDLETIFGTPTEFTRGEIIAAVKKKYSFVTIFTREDGKWKKGHSVRLALIKGREYLKTTDDPEEADTLDKLPEF
jgi:hypothetical protein